MTGNTPAALALFNAIRLSIVTAGAARSSESLGKSNEGEEQVDELEGKRAHVLWLQGSEIEKGKWGSNGWMDLWRAPVSGQVRRERTS